MECCGIMSKAIVLIIDGVGDLQTPKTALQAAKKPNLDLLAKKGICGLLSPVGRGVVPGSDTSHLRLLGYEPKVCYPGRGPLEALGLGIELREGDVAFRANFATQKDGKVIDRRAGRIDTASAGLLSKNVQMRIEDIEVIFKNSVEHRGALVLRGPGLSSCISETDPHGLFPVLECLADDESSEAKKTARIVNKFTLEIQKRLSLATENKSRAAKGRPQANAILLRGAGMFSSVPSFSDRFGITGACVAGGALYRGVAKFIGMDTFLVPGATGDKNTDLKAKGNAALKALETHDLVFLHVKACDSFGHDGDMKGKTKMIERIDKELIPILMSVKGGACIVVTGDHSTPCSRKEHSGHEIPILMYGPDERADNVKKFDEISCMDGGLGHITGKHIMPIILNMMGKAKKYGS
jgi:2,3-bisphosphoglycerate-independent phosphoglycerate mutase